MSTPAVSVCIRAYRHAEYLAAAIASVSRQTFDDFEIVVSDDSGELGHVAARFDDPRVRYSANPDPAGPAANLRRAIGLSRGTLLAILNEDDEWLPSFLATTVGRLDDDPTLGVVFADAFWEIGGRRVNTRLPFTPGRHAQFLPEILERGIPCSTTVLRRKLWDEGEIELPIQDGMVGDIALHLRAAASGRAFHFIDEPLAVIHVHRDQISWGEDFSLRAITTLQAFRFEDARCEQLRRARLAEHFMARARVHLTNGSLGLARDAIVQARRSDPRGLGLRALLALTGLRALAIRLGCSYPRVLTSALAVWRRVRPPVLP